MTDGRPERKVLEDVLFDVVEMARDTPNEGMFELSAREVVDNALCRLEAAARVRAGEAEPVAPSLFEKLHIESLTRDWFDGPKPSVDGYLEVLQSRLRRAAPPAPISAIAVVERLREEWASKEDSEEHEGGHSAGNKYFIKRGAAEQIITALRAEASGAPLPPPPESTT